jgi:transposase
MSLARLVITAVTVEGRAKSAVARDYGITRFWVQTLVKRFKTEGEAAFQPRVLRPHHNPRASSSRIALHLPALSAAAARIPPCHGAVGGAGAQGDDAADR